MTFTSAVASRDTITRFVVTHLIAVVLCVVFVLSGTASLEAAVLKLYMSPTGNDAWSGLSEVEAVGTLARVHAVLKALAPVDVVEVHIATGLYLGQTVQWTFCNGRPITFTPLNFGNQRPVFDGQGADIWFGLSASAGADTNLRFRYLKVQNYNNAITFKGNRNDPNGWNGGNELYGMYFYRIGGRYSRDGSSTSAVGFQNSRNNRVVNSHFINVENFDASAGAIHALYVAHYSSGNIIERNRFADINGDPVKTRDASNDNRVVSNEFYRTGRDAFYLDAFCEASRPDCTKRSPECPSVGNEFRYNNLHGGYYGGVATFKFGGSSAACGPLPAPRLRTSGNVKF